MNGPEARIYTVRGTHLCIAIGSMEMVFTPAMFRELAAKGLALCDQIDPQPAFERDRHLNDSELSGGNRRLGSSSDSEG